MTLFWGLLFVLNLCVVFVPVTSHRKVTDPRTGEEVILYTKDGYAWAFTPEEWAEFQARKKEASYFHG